MVQNRKGLRSTTSDRQQVMVARKHARGMSSVEQICSAEERIHWQQK
jgi:hypothetical protein